MDGNTLIITLAIVTLAIVLAIGIWQIVRNRQAKRDHEHSAVTENRPDLRSR
jgi:cytochrome oxidase assembly protein ShyY1